jgi:hypothetical protein
LNDPTLGPRIGRDPVRSSSFIIPSADPDRRIQSRTGWNWRRFNSGSAIHFFVGSSQTVVPGEGNQKARGTSRSSAWHQDLQELSLFSLTIREIVGSKRSTNGTVRQCPSRVSEGYLSASPSKRDSFGRGGRNTSLTELVSGAR